MSTFPGEVPDPLPMILPSDRAERLIFRDTDLGEWTVGPPSLFADGVDDDD